ncbi:MAG: hypothetical protein AAFN91_10325 [Pseudomonadota bacterium]
MTNTTAKTRPRTTATSKPGGRPKAEQPRDKRLNLRFSDAELADVAIKASAAGLKPTVFAREAALGHPIRALPSRTNAAAISELNRAVVEMRRVGQLVNQLARANHRDSAFVDFWTEIGRDELQPAIKQAEAALAKVLGE